MKRDINTYQDRAVAELAASHEAAFLTAQAVVALRV